MNVLVIMSQVFLYFLFSVLIGMFILLLVPNKYRPELKIPTHLLPAITIMITLFTFIPVLDITLIIAPRIGLFESLQMILTTYTVGAAWSFTLLGSSMLMLLIAMEETIEKRKFATLGILLTVGIMLTVAWSSHAFAMDPIKGILSDFIHLTAVSVWVGVLLIIGWCSLNNRNWLEFLSWFSKIAISCLIITAISGIFLMDIMVDSYVDSWVISYGQGLLIKHLFIVPLIFYAFVNGFIVKSKISKDPTFNPIPWIRIESMIMLIIFTLTAYFSQQPPPHGNYLTDDAISPLFQFIQNSAIDSSSTIEFMMSINTGGFFLLSMIFIGLLVLSIVKRASIIMSLLFICLFVTNLYLMLMMSVVIR